MSPRAATFTWTRLASGNASGSWNQPTNWTGGTLPTTTNDTANFSSLDITADSTVTLDGNREIQSLVFGDSNTGTAAGWLIQPGSPSSATLRLGGAAPSVTVNALGSGKVVRIGAELIGTNGLTKIGPGFLQLTQANTYSGATVLSGSDCRISIGHDRALGTGPVRVGAAAGAGQVWFQSAGNRVLTNDFEIRTVRWIIDWNKAGALDAGNLTLNGSVLLNAGSSNVRDIFCGKDLTLNGPVAVIPTTNPFNKQGGGTLTLNSTNTFSGPTAVNAGTLLIHGALASSGTVTVNNGTTLGGTGLVAGTVAVLDGGTLRTGTDGPGTFTCGHLLLSGNAHLSYALGATNHPANGFIRVNGNLTLDGNLNVVNLGGFSSGTYTGLWYGGTLTDRGLVVSNVPYDKTVQVQTHVPHYILFRVLEGRLNPQPGQAVPMDLADSLALGWVEIPGATAYDVFLGVASNAVYSATRNTPGLYLGRATGLAFSTGSLQPDTTYYWRADALAADGAVTKGAVLSFTTGAAMVDLMADTWVATDALGRALPGAAECGPPRSNRPIGLFYFVWHGENKPYGKNNTDFDCSKYIAAHPYTNKNNPWADNPVFNQVASGTSFYWGEPELGYYSPQDRWVLRRHVQWLTAAGVDVLGFDFTNGHPWSMYDALIALCETLRQMRCEGFQTSLKLLFLTHADSPSTVTWLYDHFFARGQYPDLWFRWQGKPLILGYPDGIDAGETPVRQEVRDFFTWRTAWANVSSLHREWQWIDSATPQDWGYDSRADIPEQVPVTCGGWATSNLGRSYTNRTQPPYNNLHLPVAGTQGLGLFFQEQMAYGLKLDPEFLFITGWNEWIAGSWMAPQNGWPSLLGNPCPLSGFYFVDEYTQEYSRDIEPMKGGHTDNYYFQMVGQNRYRKGARPIPPASAPKTIKLDGDFSDWIEVQPAFRDAPADTTPRAHAASVAGQPGYTNNTGRNDFTLLKVARDTQYLYFYARCRAPLTSSTDSNWMVLFVDADQNHATGWEGYDYAVNLGTRTSTTTTLSRHPTPTNGWAWTTVRSDIAWRAAGTELMLRVPRADLGLAADPLSFDFHWADNFQVAGDISDWGLNGDSAPDRRFNYRYHVRPLESVTLLSDDFETGKQPVWAESWSDNSRWNVTSSSSYSGGHSALCSATNGSGNAYLIARLDTTSLDSFRISFRYKLQNVADAQNLTVQYFAPTGWVTIREISRDQYHPVGQKWGYDERQNVWLQFNDARRNVAANAPFFHPAFAFRINGTGVSTSSRNVWVDDVLVTGLTTPTNRPPTLDPLPNHTLLAGQTLLITNNATDPDQPTQSLTFSLLSAPAGASIQPQTGVFSWRPTMAQAPSISPIRLAVTDNGSPPLSATQSFSVAVNLPQRPILTSITSNFGYLYFLISGDAGPDYSIQASTNLALAGGWMTVFTTNSPPLPLLWTDGQASNYLQRFYRVLLGP